MKAGAFLAPYNLGVYIGKSAKLIYKLPMTPIVRFSLFVVAACFFWAVDLIVRYPLTLKLNFVHIVFLESLVGLLVLSPWFIKKGFSELKSLTRTDWLLGVYIGGIAMTVGGYLFNVSIQKATPGTFSFFQVFQPLFVVYAAWIFLKERIDNLYFFWGVWVTLSAVLMYSQDLELMFSNPELGAHPKDIMIALGAMLLWGLSTIAAKKLLLTHNPLTVVSLRWFFAFIFSVVFMIFEGQSMDFNVVLAPDFLLRIFFISAIAGIFSMLLYYKGLQNLPAGKVSFLELSYPALGMLFSSLYTFEGLGLLQTLGALSLSGFIIMMILRNENVSIPGAKVAR